MLNEENPSQTRTVGSNSVMSGKYAVGFSKKPETSS
jgi:hypothetical protein